MLLKKNNFLLLCDVLNFVLYRFRINGNDTCTELLIEHKGPQIVNSCDSMGRLAFSPEYEILMLCLC